MYLFGSYLGFPIADCAEPFFCSSVDSPSLSHSLTHSLSRVDAFTVFVMSSVSDSFKDRDPIGEEDGSTLSLMLLTPFDYGRHPYSAGT